MLKARLYKYEIEKKEEESENLAKSKTDIGWGASNKILCFATISIGKRSQK